MISREWLKDKISGYCKGCNSYNGVKCGACDIADCLEYVDQAPDAEKHGSWVPKSHTFNLSGAKITGVYPTCDQCGYSEVGLNQETNFCPNCGADMRKTEQPRVSAGNSWKGK